MQGEPKVEMTADMFESFLDVKLADISEDDLNKPINLTFIVSPVFTIFVSKSSHEFLSRNFGVDLEDTRTEGYIRINPGSQPKINFKPGIYQSRPAFKKPEKERMAMIGGVKQKLLSTLSK